MTSAVQQGRYEAMGGPARRTPHPRLAPRSRAAEARRIPGSALLRTGQVRVATASRRYPTADARGPAALTDRLRQQARIRKLACHWPGFPVRAVASAEAACAASTSPRAARAVLSKACAC